VHAILADQRVERRHFRDVGRRHRHALLGSEDVELVWIKHQTPVAAKMYGLPELIWLICTDRIHIDYAGVTARAITGEVRWLDGRKADAQVEAVADCGFSLDEPDIRVNFAQPPVAHAARPLVVGIELLADSPPEPDLIEPRTVADFDRKGARTNLGKKR